MRGQKHLIECHCILPQYRRALNTVYHKFVVFSEIDDSDTVVPKFAQCNNCGVIGHLAGQCPEPAQCHCCGSTQHAVAECPHREKTCEICGKKGHLKAKCRAAN